MLLLLKGHLAQQTNTVLSDQFGIRAIDLSLVFFMCKDLLTIFKGFHAF